MKEKTKKPEHRASLWKSAHRGDVIFAFVLRALFILSAVISLYYRNIELTAVAAVSLFLTFIPVLLEKSIKVSLPVSFQVVLLIFIFAAQFLGEIFNYYERYWWWDILLHSWSGVLLGTIGFLLVYILNNASGVDVILSPFFIGFFALCFAVTCGVVWEIFEFSMDVVFGTNMQKSGLVDTMWDLVVDTGGALIVSVNGWLTMRARKDSPVTRAVSLFMRQNPDLRDKL